MKKSLKINIAVAAAVMTAAAGCTPASKVSYLTDLVYGESVAAQSAPDVILQENDVLNVKVFCDEAALTKPFQLASADGSFMKYEIDSLGCIDFPVLGVVGAAGKTPKEVGDELEDLIAATGYIKDPVVQVEMANFTVTVIGPIGNKDISVEGGKINLLQLLSKVDTPEGDVALDDVMVIRSENGSFKPYKVDLRTKEMFSSPVFYLKQNDVVYFKPRGTKMSNTGSTIITLISPGLTLASIITNFLLWTGRR